MFIFLGYYFRFITYQLWVLIGRFLLFVCPGFVLSKLNSCKIYCCDRPNPFLMIFYLFLIVGGYTTFLISLSHLVPNKFVGEEHWYIFLIFVVYDLAWFYHVHRSNPGTVTKDNCENYIERFKYDYVLYFPKKCEKCNVLRPARAKHCYICNRCVARFDHHCAWVNNDIGAENLWKFLLFLLNTGFICLYCSYLSYNCLLYYAWEKKIILSNLQ